jgi:phosphomevalonate kinase
VRVIATAPGKLILTGEYAVLDGAPALVAAVDRRAIARRGRTPGSSPFLLAVAAEIAARRGADSPAARAASEIAVDSSGFFDGELKLGLGSSAAVTVAATARALGEVGPIDRDEVLAIAAAAHASAQGARGARGSGADVHAAVHGGLLAFTAGHVERRRWPDDVMLVPFFTGQSADTATLVARVAAARAAKPAAVGAALDAVAEASQAACAAVAAPADLAATATIAAFSLASFATSRLASVTGVDLVPPCVIAARSALARVAGTAKTTGAGGGDVAVGVMPATTDVTEVARLLIEAGCRPLRLSIDETGVDLQPDAQ